MGRVIVRYNYLPAVIRALPAEIDRGVDETAEQLANYLKPRLWRDTGAVVSTTVDKPEGLMHAEVGVGYHLGKGFYARFHEWGTHGINAYGIIVKPRPVVGPGAHVHEPILADNVSEGVRRACNAR